MKLQFSLLRLNSLHVAISSQQAQNDGMPDAVQLDLVNAGNSVIFQGNVCH